MGQILAALKTIATIITTVKQIILLGRKMYKNKLDAEKAKAKVKSENHSSALQNELSKKVADSSDAELKKLLREKMGL